jgi:hypothetical protein
MPADQSACAVTFFFSIMGHRPNFITKQQRNYRSSQGSKGKIREATTPFVSKSKHFLIFADHV